MRVSVQLIDAESGHHLWAERFDKPLADLFDMQDEIVARLANTLGTQLVDAEARWAERAQSPDSTDLVFRGRALLTKGITPDNVAEANRLFERALALDPTSVAGLVSAAAADFALALNFLPDDRAARFDAAEVALTKALSLAPDNAVAHLCLGVIQMHTARADQGVRACERALELDRNLANAHALIGNGKLLLGRPEDTEAHVQEALRLSPLDTHAYLWCAFAGLAKFHLGKDEEAVTWLRRSIDANRKFPNSHFALAAALACLGRLPEARSEVRTGLAINPTFTISRVRAMALSAAPDVFAGRERFIDGLRKAGVSEE
jgi:tetratricopeptide (TPR) repeat protein